MRQRFGVLRVAFEVYIVSNRADFYRGCHGVLLFVGAIRLVFWDYNVFRDFRLHWFYGTVYRVEK